MALILPGLTACGICGEVIAPKDDIVGFSPFVMNEADELFLFNDAAFHRACFETHPLSDQAAELYDFIQETYAHRNMVCMISGRQITDPDDFFTTGYLIRNPTHPLHRWNCFICCRSLLSEWMELDEVCRGVRDALASGAIRGNGYQTLLQDLESHAGHC
ncbi:MAG: hypothetical protein JJU33_00415 [Phycisphaerales bacterium]|nr:hypothetical protein [Phycisphaerales bacterium]